MTRLEICRKNWAGTVPLSNSGIPPSPLQVKKMEGCINETDFVILEEGFVAMDVIDQKINEKKLTGNTDAFYVADLGELVNKHLQWQTTLPRVKPFYAVKCNDRKLVVWILAQLDTGFDCASKNEIALIQDIGVPPERIIYANPCKESSHIKFAATHGIQMMTFDNEDEISKVARIHPTAKMVLRIATNDAGSTCPLSAKFGASLEECRRLMECAKALSVDIIGVSFHVGSGCANAQAFAQAIADSRLVFDVGMSLGFHMNLLDIGGGFPGFDDDNITFEEIAAVINPALHLHFPEASGVNIIAEPGRYYVTSSFTMAVNIIGRKIINMDSTSSNDDEAEKTIMYYINDGWYGSLRHESAPIKLLVFEKLGLDQQLFNTKVWGPTCDSIDCVTDHWKLPKLEIGDWLLIQNRGAYSVSLSSTFNGFQRTTVHYVITKEAWETLQKIKSN
ncbi:antizyme inhibitor 2-like isoform X2 [Pristis pectinata]|uniref:antizyme inhibitor 2-like isoform X2 n=1 Tax=Pristis pectinata TaxID=685728 RepID=UPI00223E6D05|nr:antizyme inhibitor 2-like isoform X2 [Pristis pectinata]XP_051871877.1 antizyme inhibitor 2-like isoform X2 [Pristis pectinata]